MNRKVLTLILCLLLVLLLIAATVWYNSLSSDFEAESSAPDESKAEQATDFDVYDFDGNPVSLSDKFGKPIVVNFWASWCGPCKAELPAFEKMYNKYGDEVEFMMVNLTGGRETVEGVKEFLELSGHVFPVYFDIDMSAAMNYGLNSIPRTFFINADGSVYGSHMGSMDEKTLESYIEKINITD